MKAEILTLNYEKFYMIFVEGKSMPIKKHFSQQEALREASRLAHKTKTATYVLQTIGYYDLVPIQISIQWIAFTDTEEDNF